MSAAKPLAKIHRNLAINAVKSLFASKPMHTAVLLVWISSFLVISATLILINFSTKVYSDINELTEFLATEIKIFKDKTDQSWNDLQDLQAALTPIRRKKSVATKHLLTRLGIQHRVKPRQSLQSISLPSWCQCEPQQPRCPPGPPGPPGSQGTPGAPGERGAPGRDNFNSYPAVECAPRDYGCVRCPAGPPGFRGPPGKEGLRGPPGSLGAHGITPTSRGRPGSPGQRGEQGLPGMRGKPGERGSPGRNGVIPVRRIGPPGPPGKVGPPGESGRPGIRAQDGLPGAMGPMGLPGYAGERGKSGPDGIRGRTGPPGHDAGYCTCPKRTLLYSKNAKT